jgi:hypothetical protein
MMCGATAAQYVVASHFIKFAKLRQICSAENEQTVGYGSEVSVNQKPLLIECWNELLDP